MFYRVKRFLHTSACLLVSSYLTCPTLLAAPLYYTRHDFPEDLGQAKFIEYRHGCGGGVSIIEVEGKKFALKSAENPKYLEREALTNLLYGKLGVRSPQFAIYDSIGDLANSPEVSSHISTNTTLFMLSEFIEGSNLRSIQDPRAKQSIADQLKDGFLADAFLTNWDLHDDNIRLDAHGNTVRVDNGAGLGAHGAGGWKTPSDQWDFSSVSDLRTMRLPHNQHEYFKGLREKEIYDQIQGILDHKEDVLQGVMAYGKALHMEDTEALCHLLLKRFEYLEILKSRTSIALADKDELVGLSGAGTFIYTMIEGVPHALLAKRAGNGSFCNPGGKSDFQDKFMYDSAARETREETHGKIRITAEKLRDCPSHDLLPDYIHNMNEKDLRYRMYFMEHDFVDPLDFLLKSEDASAYDPNNNDQEFTEFKWVPVHLLINPNERINLPNGEDITLFEPLHKMLGQAPVVDLLQKIEKKQPLPKRHTQGLENPNDGINALSMDDLTVLWRQTHPSETLMQSFGAFMGYRSFIHKESGHIVFEQPMFGDPQKIARQIARSVISHGQGMMALKNATKRIDRDIVQDEEKKDERIEFYEEMHGDMSQGASDYYMRHVLGDDYQEVEIGSPQEALVTKANIKATLEKQQHGFSGSSDPFIDIYVAMIMNERRHPKAIASYHATTPEVASTINFTTKVRELLSLKNRPNSYFMRGVDRPFRYQNVHAFIEAFRDESGAIDNYEDHPKKGRYTDMGLSVVPFLLGGPTARFFENGQSAVAFYGQSLMNTMLAYLGVSMTAEQWLQVFSPYLEKDGKRNGAIYQMLMTEDQSREMSYMAVRGGTELMFFEGKEETSSIDPLLLLKNNPKAFWDALTKARTKNQEPRKDASNNAEVIKADDIQLRHYMKPQIWQGVDIFESRHFKGDDEAISLLADRNVAEILFNNREIPHGTFYENNDDTMDVPHPLALKKLHRYIYEGVTGEALHDRPIAKDMFAEFLDKGNLEGMRLILSKYPDFDLTKPIKEVGGKGKSGVDEEKTPLKIAYDLSIESEVSGAYSEIGFEIIHRILAQKTIQEFLNENKDATDHLVHFAISSMNEAHLEQIANLNFPVSPEAILKGISTVRDKDQNNLNAKASEFFERVLQKLMPKDKMHGLNDALSQTFETHSLVKESISPHMNALLSGNLDAFSFLWALSQHYQDKDARYQNFELKKRPGLNVLHVMNYMHFNPSKNDSFLDIFQSIDQDVLVKWLGESFENITYSENHDDFIDTQFKNKTPLMSNITNVTSFNILFDLASQHHWVGLTSTHESLLSVMTAFVGSPFSDVKERLKEVPKDVMKKLLHKKAHHGFMRNANDVMEPVWRLPILASSHNPEMFDYMLALSKSHDFAGLLDENGTIDTLKNSLQNNYFNEDQLEKILTVIKENPDVLKWDEIKKEIANTFMQRYGATMSLDLKKELLNEALKSQPSDRFYIYHSDNGFINTLTEVLPENPHITQLSTLYFNNSALHEMVDLIRTNKTVKSITMFNNNLDDQNVAQIFDAMRMNTTLTTLDLSNNKITDEGAKTIADFIETNTTLEALSLTHNNITDKGALMILESLKKNKSIKGINLYQNSVSDNVIFSIVSFLQSRQISQP